MTLIPKLLAGLILLLTTANLATACGDPGPYQVVLYKDKHFKGSCVVLNPGHYNNPSAMGISGDSISSVKVGSSVRLTLFKDTGFRGQPAFYESEQHWYALGNVEDETSSAVVDYSNGSRIPYRYLGNNPGGSTKQWWTRELNGVAHDHSNWFFSKNQPSELIKIPFTQNLAAVSIDRNTNVVQMPADLASQGYNHFGDIDQYKGFIFIPVEGPNLQPLVAVFRTNLAYVGSYPLSPIDGRSAAWLAIDQNTGRLFSSGGTINGLNPINIYQIQTLNVNLPFGGSNTLLLGINHTGNLNLYNQFWGDVNLKIPQGGAVSSDGRNLYITTGLPCSFGSCPDQGDGFALYVFDLQSGKLEAKSGNGYGPFNLQFNNGFSAYQEPEGLDFFDTTELGPNKINGGLHVILLENESGGDDMMFFKHYGFY
jgi:hypothetical protein